MAKGEKGKLEKETEKLSKNLAKCRPILGRSKILMEDVNSLTILSIENSESKVAARRREAKTKSS